MRDCQECFGRGEVGPSDDSFVCPHCRGSRRCPSDCEWIDTGVRHRPADEEPAA
jgi:hypothetical protein